MRVFVNTIPTAAPVLKPSTANIRELDNALQLLAKFMPRGEHTVFRLAARSGEERQHFIDTAIDLARRIQQMPHTYQTDGQGDAAIVHLHYFAGGSDWYITEKDKDGDGTTQAFGWVILNGDTQCAELGYVCIAELVELGIELDLYWTPTPLAEVKRWKGC